MENNQLQNNEKLLPGGFGSITIKSTGNIGMISSAMKNKDGSVTLTVSPNKKELIAPVTEDIDHEVVQPKQIENGH